MVEVRSVSRLENSTAKIVFSLLPGGSLLHQHHFIVLVFNFLSYLISLQAGKRCCMHSAHGHLIIVSHTSLRCWGRCRIPTMIVYF
jgi:hypothetical protein